MALIGNAGKLALGISDFGLAEDLFVEAADEARATAETGAEAEARYNAYQAALGAIPQSRRDDLMQCLPSVASRYPPRLTGTTGSWLTG